MAAFIIRAIEGEPVSYNPNPYFADVPPTHWAFKYVQRVRERGIAQGYPGTNLYGPDDNVTREQMAKMLIMGLVSQGKITEPPSDYCSTEAPFPDVERDRWSCRFIKKLKELNITTGYPDGTYRPENPVTRAEMAAFIYRAFLSSISLPAEFKFYSPTIPENGTIPLKYVMPGAGGQNVSPPLKWEGIPSGTKSLVLLMYDRHPIADNWIHWIVINIPTSVTEFPEGASGRTITSPARELINTYGFRGYGGPEPPPGTGQHPYVFRLYALSVPEINLSSQPSYDEIIRAVQPYVIDYKEFVGYFGR
jgi:Raf kinase inhibitor-like YbhB/YbcL family protein